MSSPRKIHPWDNLSIPRDTGLLKQEPHGSKPLQSPHYWRDKLAPRHSMNSKDWLTDIFLWGSGWEGVSWVLP